MHDGPARGARLGDDHTRCVEEPDDDGDGVLGHAHGGSHPGAGQLVLDHGHDDGADGREVDGDAGEGMQDADGGGSLVEQDEEAVGEADDAVAAELRQADADAPAGGGAEEGDRPRMRRPRAHAVAVA